jgi:hypothetical protein
MNWEGKGGTLHLCRHNLLRCNLSAGGYYILV